MLAVAGSGKTTHLINRLNLEQRFLLVTYTRNNYEHLKMSIVRKFGFFPGNIKVMKYFQFVYSFCYMPFCGLDHRANGISFNMPPERSRFHPNKRSFYMSDSGLLYHNRIAHYCIKNCIEGIKGRLDKYYDFFMVDEVQDFAANDFNLLLKILPETCNTICVGDFFQHTFDTSRDGNTRASLYDDYMPYKKVWEKAGVAVDESTLLRTHRCSEAICDFVRQMGISIESTGKAQGTVLHIKEKSVCERIINDPSIPKLFYKDSSKYSCAGMNWGASKGLDHFIDVCVVMNKSSYDLYLNGKLKDMNPKTKNKLYVACTRAHRDLYIMSETWFKAYKQQ